MCCYSSPKCMRGFVESLGRRTTFIAWKLVWHNGTGRYSNYVFAPGTHRTTIRPYNVRRPRGFHVFLDKPTVPSGRPGLRILPVVCRVADLVRVNEHPPAFSLRDQQAVLTRIRITRKAWKQAGLPKVPRKRV